MSVYPQYEQTKLILEKIRTVTPLLTLKEKKKICPVEQFGKIVIVLDSSILVSEFFIEVDKEDEGRSKNHRFTLKEPYGKHLVRASWKMIDFNGDDPSMVSSNEIKVELSEETPEVYLRLKRGPKLEYAKKEMPN